MPKLSEIFTLQMGKTPTRAKNEYWNNGDNDWVSISDLSTYDKYVGETKETISDLAVMESGIKPAPADTVIMSFKLSLGKTAITVKPTYTNEAIMAFIPNGNYPVHTSYFYHFFVGYDWSNGTNRAVMGSTLNKATLSEIEITVPSIMEQIEIANCLDKIDALISLRKQQLSKFDELVKSRFIEMFDGKYETKPLQDVCEELFAGGDVKKDKSSDVQSNEYPYPIYTNGEKDNGLYGYTSLVRVRKEAVTISGRGTIGFTCLRKEPFYPAVRLIVAVPKQDLVSGCYLQHFIQSKNYGGQGASIPQLTVPMIKDELIPVPPIDLQNEFATFVEQVDKSKFEIQKSPEKLETLKKSLMQKYFG